MTHLFEVMIEKNEGTEDMNPMYFIYSSESQRKNKVGKMIRSELLKKNMIEEKAIKNIYLNQAR